MDFWPSCVVCHKPVKEGSRLCRKHHRAVEWEKANGLGNEPPVEASVVVEEFLGALKWEG